MTTSICSASCSHFGRFVNSTGYGPGERVGRHKNKAGADKCISSFTVRIRSLSTPKRRVYDYIINHTFEKQPWQPEYDMRITWEGSVDICYDIITHTSKAPWQSVERVCITWGSVEICYTYLNRIVPKCVHILADS